MKAYSRFTLTDLTPKTDGKTSPLPSDWYQEAEDEKFRLNLSQTREALSEALRYKQAWEFLIQEVKSIAEGRELPLAKERRLAACLRIVRKNWPELSG